MPKHDDKNKKSLQKNSAMLLNDDVSPTAAEDTIQIHMPTSQDGIGGAPEATSRIPAPIVSSGKSKKKNQALYHQNKLRLYVILCRQALQE